MYEARTHGSVRGTKIECVDFILSLPYSILLQFHIIPLNWVDTAAVWLLIFMGLFYVPYGVGIVESGDLIEQWGLKIIGLVLVTVLSVFVVSGLLFQSLVRKKLFYNE